MSSSEDENQPQRRKHNYRQQSEEADNYEGSERDQNEYQRDGEDEEQDRYDADNGVQEQDPDEENEEYDNEPQRQAQQNDEDELGDGNDDDDDPRPSNVTINQTIIVNKEERPATQGAPKDELLQAGAIFLKQLFAAQTNAKGGHQNTPLTHQEVQHHISDEHEDGDWRVMMLQTSNDQGEMFSLEAKMDTGSDYNWMNEDAAQHHEISWDVTEGPEMPNFRTGTGASMSPDGIATLKYTAGVHNRTYVEDFYVRDGIPHDIILGIPFLEHSHAITLDPEFARPHDDPDFLLIETKPLDKKKAAENAAAIKQKQLEREARLKKRDKKK